MNTPKTKQRNRILHLAILGVALMLSTMQSQAQTRDIDEEDREIETDDRRYINGLNQENFKSDFGTDQRDRNIDYSTEDRRSKENNYDIFGNDNEQNFKFDEIQTEQNNRTNSNGGSIMIQGPQGGNDVNPKENVNMPSVSDPFKQGQTGIKAPRNMDAVPDNGDDPNDVPLDGGISILGLAAAAYGWRKFKK
jgi:hypothetical protein